MGPTGTVRVRAEEGHFTRKQPVSELKGVPQKPDGHAPKGDEKHERTAVQRRVRGFGQRTNCGWVHSPPGMAAAYEPTPKGALALHLTGPLGKGRCDTVV